MLINYIINVFKYFFCILIFVILSLPANSEMSVEEIIKGRKALFSKNYSTAKRVQALASKGEFDKAKSLMIEMSENYKTLIEYFPDNTKEGFKKLYNGEVLDMFFFNLEIQDNFDLADIFYEIHILGNYTLIALISLHISAVIIHKLLFKENLLKRIL